MVALDTNIAIDFLRGDNLVKDKVLTFKKIYLPVTVCGELIFGAENSSKKEINLKQTRKFINTCSVLDCNYLVAEKYSLIRKHLKEKGKPIPENDIWIAAVSMANNIPLLTKDKHFQNIDIFNFELIN